MVDGTSITTRSALEARWAIFFSELHLKWHYEARRLIFNGGGHYTPDFLVERFGFVEIKPALDLLIKESSTKLERAARNCTTEKIYAFCGERVGFDTVAIYHGKSIFAPNYSKMLHLLGEAIGTTWSPLQTLVEVAMNRANRAKLDHFVSVGKVLELETIPELNQVRKAQ